MTDDQLIDYIAKIWVDNGGDEDGIHFCYYRIAERVKQITEEKEQLAMEVNEDE